MRVSQRWLIQSAVERLHQNQEALEERRTQIASGRRLHRPHDDPQGVQQALNLRAALSSVQSHLRNLDFSRDWMDATDASLGSLAEVLGSARLTAVQAANETLSASQRLSFAAAVREQFKQIGEIANTAHRGQYLFAGYRVSTQPFAVDPDTLTATYEGDSGSISHEIEPGTCMVVNVSGDAPAFQAAFKAVADLVTALETNDTAAIREAIASLDNATDMVLLEQATIGARAKVLEEARSRLQEFEINLRSLLSRTEDTDMAQAILESGSYEMGYQATLTAMSHILPRSLFDYLG